MDMGRWVHFCFYPLTDDVVPFFSGGMASTLLKQLAHILDMNDRISQLPVAAGHDIVIIRIQLQRAGTELTSALNEIKEAYAAHETRSHVFRRAREQS